jgi:hypothetical protein
MANDRVKEQAAALLNSIRLYDKDTPIILIPYDNKYSEIAKLFQKPYGVEIFPDLELVERICQNVRRIFGRKVFPRPEQFRKQASWFGPFDEFLYLDTDIVVFEKIINALDYLVNYDFVNCDYQYKNGIKFLFTPKILEDKVVSPIDLKNVFNAGFWASKKGLVSEEMLYGTFNECLGRLEYFDFSSGVTDMPVFNYLVLKLIKRKFNIVRDTGIKGPGEWAGCPHFKREGNILVDPNVNQPLKYLHWAGIKIEPGCPYYDVWEYYRRAPVVGAPEHQ